jgi:ribosomal protein S18 acetylase RimI-like enzyme
MIPGTAFDALARAGDANHAEWLREMSRWSPRGQIEESDGLLLYSSGTPFPVTYNGVVRLDPAVSPAEVLARADAWFATLDRGYTVVTSDHHGVDDDLQQAAEQAGLLLVGEPPEMVLTHPVEPATLPDGFELGWVRHGDDLDAFLSVCAASYGTIGMPPGTVEAAITDLGRFTAPWIHSVVARRDGQPLAAAQVILAHGIAGVYWVGTVEAARGTGLGDAVTRAVTNRAFDAGAKAVTLQASKQGEPIYQRMGYETIYRYHNWVRFDPDGR